MKASDKFERSRHSGHTLPELLAVLAIIAILSAFSISYSFAQIQKARDVQIQSDLREVAIDIQVYAAHYGYPPDANPGIVPATEITFPVEQGRILDWDLFCVNGVRWAKVLSYPMAGRTDDYSQPGAIGEWTHTGKDWALTLWIGKC